MADISLHIPGRNAFLSPHPPQASRPSHCTVERKKRIGQAEKATTAKFKATTAKKKEKKNAQDCWKKVMHNYYKSLIKELENDPSHDKAETFHRDLCL